MGIYSHNKEEIESIGGNSVAEISGVKSENRVNWLNVDGVHNIELINEVGKAYKLNSLVLKDVLHVD